MKSEMKELPVKATVRSPDSAQSNAANYASDSQMFLFCLHLTKAASLKRITKPYQNIYRHTYIHSICFFSNTY